MGALQTAMSQIFQKQSQEKGYSKQQNNHLMWFINSIFDLWSGAFFPGFVFENERYSAGKRDLHFSECSEEFVRAEATQASAAGGGQRTGRLHWYWAVSVCKRVCVCETERDHASAGEWTILIFLPIFICFEPFCFSNQIKQPENEESHFRYYYWLSVHHSAYGCYQLKTIFLSFALLNNLYHYIQFIV